MADEGGRLSTYDDEFKRSQEERFAQLLNALQRGPIPPAPDNAPARGIDAMLLQQVVNAIVGEKTSVFLTRDQIRDLVKDVVASEESTKRTQRLVDERLGFIGLRMDEGHIDQTRDSLGGAMRWHRLASRTLLGAAGTILAGFVYAAARKLGLPVPGESG